MTDEVSLLHAWTAGDLAAGNRLIDRVYPRIARFFRTKVDGVELEADLIQQTVLGLVEARDRLQDHHAFWGFVYAIARNVLREHIRQRLRLGREEVDFTQVCVSDLGRSLLSVMSEKRDLERLAAALREIPLADQLLLELRFVEGCKAREIAEITGIPRGSVHRELGRCIERLKTKLHGSSRGGSTSLAHALAEFAVVCKTSGSFAAPSRDDTCH